MHDALSSTCLKKHLPSAMMVLTRLLRLNVHIVQQGHNVILVTVFGKSIIFSNDCKKMLISGKIRAYSSFTNLTFISNNGLAS